MSLFEYVMLERHSVRFCRERAEGRGSVFERKDLAVAVICGVHALEVRILVEYCLACLEAIVEYSIRLDAQPATLVIDGADGDARMRKHLMRNGLHFARLDVEPPLELGDGAKGPYLRVSLFVDRCEE